MRTKDEKKVDALVAKQYRIGNLVKTCFEYNDDCDTAFDYINKVVAVSEILDGKISIKNNGDKTNGITLLNHSAFKNIPLTREVLKTLGLKRVWDKYDRVYKLSDVFYLVEECTVCYLAIWAKNVDLLEGGFIKQLQEVKYLHELQNLFYDFNKRELIFSWNELDKIK